MQLMFGKKKQQHTNIDLDPHKSTAVKQIYLFWVDKYMPINVLKFTIWHIG